MKSFKLSKGASVLIAAAAALTTVGAGLPASAATPAAAAQAAGDGASTSARIEPLGASINAVASSDYFMLRSTQTLGPNPSNKSVFTPYSMVNGYLQRPSTYAESGQADTFIKGLNLATAYNSTKFDFSDYRTNGDFVIRQQGNTASCLNHVDSVEGAITFGACTTASRWKLGSGGQLVSSATPTMRATVYMNTDGSSFIAMGDQKTHPLANFHAVSTRNGLIKDIYITEQSWNGDDLTIKGSSEPDTEVKYKSKTVTVNAKGKWTMTIRNVAANTSSVTVTQIIAGEEMRSDSIYLDPRVVPVTDAIVGATNPRVSLDAGQTTTAPFQIKSNKLQKEVTGKVTLDAPSGSTFESSPSSLIAEKYDAASKEWVSTLDFTLHDPVISTDKKTVTYTISSGAKEITAGQLLRYSPKVVTPADAKAGESSLGVRFSGTTSIGSFNSTSNVPTITVVAPPVVIAAPVVDSPEAGSTVEVSRPVFTGHGEPGAKIAIGYSAKSLIGQTTVNASGDWTITPTAGLALGKSDLVVIQTAGTDVQTITYTINRVAAEAPFRVTSHVNNQTYAEGMTTFRGTSASDASIKAVNQWGTVMGSTTADKNGNWAFSRNLGPTTEGYTITFTASKNGKVETETLHLNYQGQVAFQVTSPVNNSVYKEGNTTFVGKASPNTQIKAVNQWGTAMGSATANLDGDWTFSRILGPTTAGYDITFTATKGTDVQRSVLHLNPEVLNVPVQVTSINDGDTYIPGQNILKGTGTPGATVDAVNATNGWNVPMGSAKVGTDGKWELPSRNWGPSNDYAIKVTQTNPDKTKSTVTVNIKAPRFTALTVDNVTIGNPVGAGVTATFTGKASPLATIEVKSANTGSVYQKVTADKDGNWSAARTWDPNHTYNLSFTQKATDGTTDTVDYGTFTAVK